MNLTSIKLFAVLFVLFIVSFSSSPAWSQPLPAHEKVKDRAVVWQIGHKDGSSNEFNLAPGNYKQFVQKFSGEHQVYYIGYSDAQKDWAYVLPGPTDNWAGGGFWSGSYPRHLPRIFFNLDKSASKAASILHLNFTDVAKSNPPVIKVDVNGFTDTIKLNSGNGQVLSERKPNGKQQSFSISIPSLWLKDGLNVITIHAISGSWATFDNLEFESKYQLAAASSSLILSVKAADFEIQKGKSMLQPLLLDIHQLDHPNSLTVEIQGLAPVSKFVEVGHSILEIPMPASGKNKTLFNQTVVIRSKNKVIYKGLITRKSQRLQTYADYADLLIGTGNSRWMFKPGPSLPLSMVQIAPDNQNETWKSGYEYTVDNIMGFSHFSDWTMCGLLMMPTGGKLQVNPGDENDPDGGYRSRIDKKSESAKIGKYSVFMTDTHIKAEITATRRAALQRYTFPKMDSARIIVDLFSPGEYPQNLVYAKITRRSATEVEGTATYQNSFTGYTLDQLYTIHFILQFSKPFETMGGWVTDVKPVTNYIPNWNINHQFSDKTVIFQNVKELTGKGGVGSFFNFKTKAGEVIMVRSGVSLVDLQGARNNLETEMTKPFGWDFEKVVQNARNIWNDYLGRLEIETDDHLQKVKFYSNMYRAIAAKAVWSDVDGRYVDERENVKKLNDPDDCIISGEYWNTFWNNQQLFNLIAPEISSKWTKSAIALCQNSGWFNTDPAGVEHTGVMVAMHVASQIQGAWQSGIRDFDLDTAYAGLKKMLTTLPMKYDGGGTVGIENLEPYMQYGYVPESMGEVSNTMEYAFDDWCLSQMALNLNKQKDYQYFYKRSQNWLNVFDPESGFMRPKDKSGKWIEPFDPYHTPGFVEGNAFNYNWFVPQDPLKLISAVGKERFLNRLNSAMEKSALANFNALGDDFSSYPINHGNEPAMHVAYLFNWAGQPWLTQKWNRAIQEQYYGITPYDAYPGDEDLGQMSSWFIMSSLGLFQTDGGCSVDPVYELGSPRYPKVTIHLDGKYGRGKSFTIIARNASKENKYISAVKLNGKPLKDFKFPQKDLLKGGVLEMVMSSKPTIYQ